MNKKVLTKIQVFVILQNNIRKATTERVVRYESSREDSSLVEAVYEDGE